MHNCCIFSVICSIYVICLLSVDKPTKLEKTRMAQSIVARFPILKADGIVGHVSFLYNDVAIYISTARALFRHFWGKFPPKLEYGI